MRKGQKLGVLIPEFPGQTHSFFWREIAALHDLTGTESQIISTRLPARPVHHDWVAQTDPVYLFPLRAPVVAGLILPFLISIVRLLADAPSRAVLRHPKNWAFVLMALRLGQICQARNIGHLHVHSCANFALIAAFCHKLTGLPYSLVLHGPLKDYGPYQPYKWAGAAFVFVITDVLMREMQAQMPEISDKMSVVPMGVNTDVFAPPSTAREDHPDPFIWFCCARLNRVKGYDTLLAATAQLAQDGHALHLVIAGEDEQGGQGYRQTLQSEIETTGLQDKVTLLGSVTQETVRDHLQDSNGFVLASRHEPLGVAYMEAMATELPTIGTRAGGVEELISDGVNGLLVAPDDPEALAQAMAQVMQDASLRQRLAQAGRSHIAAHFGSDRSARHLAQALHLEHVTTDAQ